MSDIEHSIRQAGELGSQLMELLTECVGEPHGSEQHQRLRRELDTLSSARVAVAVFGLAFKIYAERGREHAALAFCELVSALETADTAAAEPQRI